MNNEQAGNRFTPGRSFNTIDRWRFPAGRVSSCLWPIWGLIALFLCGFGPPTMVDRDVAPRQRFTVGQLRQIQQAQTPPPEISAVSVLVYDLDSGRELMTKAAHLPVSPASLAKLMTALLVLEQNRLEE
ncbi:MAG: hypothetical protein OXC27_19230, partial [Caldilineaceae bacterium]|nr:hypothetical protein [Caldilineaceae bacterium]